MCKEIGKKYNGEAKIMAITLSAYYPVPQRHKLENTKIERGAANSHREHYLNKMDCKNKIFGRNRGLKGLSRAYLSCLVSRHTFLLSRLRYSTSSIMAFTRRMPRPPFLF